MWIVNKRNPGGLKVSEARYYLPYDSLYRKFHKKNLSLPGCYEFSIFKSVYLAVLQSQREAYLTGALSYHELVYRQGVQFRHSILWIS